MMGYFIFQKSTHSGLIRSVGIHVNIYIVAMHSESVEIPTLCSRLYVYLELLVSGNSD